MVNRPCDLAQAGSRRSRRAAFQTGSFSRIKWLVPLRDGGVFGLWLRFGRGVVELLGFG
jgi:hypothetical protein